LRYRPSRTQVGELLDEIRAAGLIISDLGIVEADLEAIFLRLTGFRAEPETSAGTS
jgi:ABC-2 type transport system ATP-binding protein